MAMEDRRKKREELKKELEGKYGKKSSDGSSQNNNDSASSFQEKAQTKRYIKKAELDAKYNKNLSDEERSALSYLSDAYNFSDRAVSDYNSQYSNITWGNAASTLAERESALSDLNTRGAAIGEWLKKNERGNIDQRTYNMISGIAGSFGDYGSSTLENYKMLKDYYAQWDSEEAYNEEKRQQDLIEEQLKDYNAESGKEGYDSYISAQEELKRKEKEQQNNEAWYEKLGRWLSGSTADTSLPGGTMVYAQQGYEDSAKRGSEYKPAEDWTDEERNTFGYLYQTGGNYKLYAKKINLAHAAESRNAQLKKVEDASTNGFWGGAANTVGSLLAGTVGGTVEYLDYIMKMNAGVNPNDNYNRDISPFEYSQAVTGSISTELNDLGTLNESIPIVGGKGWGDVYQLGYSIAQSQMMALSGNPALTASTFFGNAAASGIRDAKGRGATDEQAVVLGTLYGLAESAAEKFSIEHLVNLGSASTLKGFFINVLKQGGVEASEEAATAILNLFADNLVMADKSELNRLINEYRANGVENAEFKAWMDIAEGVAYDTLTGFISGSVSAGGMQTIGVITNSYNAGKLYGGDAQAMRALADESLEIDPTNEYAQRMKARLDSGKKISGYQINRLTEANENAMYEQDRSTIQSAAAERLNQYGETGNVDAIAKALAKQAAGEKLTLSEKNIIKNSKYGQRVANELNPENIRSGEYSSAWAEKLGTNRINADEYGRLLSELDAENVTDTNVGSKTPEVGEPAEIPSPAPEASAQQAETVKANENPSAEGIASEGKFEASADGKTILTATGEEVSVKEIASIKNGNITLRLDNGKTVNASDVSFGTSNEALLYGMVADMGVNPQTATALIRGFNEADGVSAKDYTMQASLAYQYGRINYEKGLDKLDLTPKQKSIAYVLGKEDAKAETKAKQEKLEKAKSEETTKNPEKIKSTDTINADKNANKGKKKGKVHFEGAALVKNLNERQKASVKALNVLAEALGIDIYVFESPVNEKGEHIGSNGWYDPSDNSIHIDLYAGVSGESTMLFTAAHELTHHIKEKLPAKFKVFADFLIEQYAEKGVPVDELVQRQIEKAKKNGRDIDFDTAYEEVIADSCESFLADGEAIQKLAAQDKTLWETIKDFITKLVSKIKAVYEGLTPDSPEGRYVAEMLDSAEKLKKMWTELLVEASDLAAIDTDTESVSPMFSERTWTESEYVTERENTAKNISKTLGVDIETAYKYIDDINGVARLIAYDRARLDYAPNLDETATVLKPNSEYKYSVDMSTLCAKRLLFTGTFDAIQRALPNTVFDSEDIVALREMMQKRNYEVACGICYVESTRREIGKITQDFIDSYKESQKTGKPITRINSEGKVVELKKTKDQKETTVDKSTDKFFAEKGYTPTLADLNTTDIDLVKRDHPLVYEAYLNFMNARGQAKPKLLETRAEYKGEILKHFKYTSAVNARNNAGGLRLQSFSDFEVPHMIDMMQIVMDMSRVGLKSQAYTKVPAFAEIFGDSGIKINLSLIAKGDGLDAKGNLIFDDVEGINHKEAFALRDKYSKNVGTILVGKTDAHIIAAMADPRIDYIIPFHKSSWKESLYDALGLTGYADYTDFQNEKPIDKDRKIKNYDPSEYWDFTKSGDENAQIYLEKCREDGRIPKFPQFQGYPGYWKLLIDFKMYDNDSVGSPQEVVKPIFNTEASEKILREYKGGHKSFPVAKDVVEDFVKEYKSKDKVKYSDRYQSAEENSDILSMASRVENGNFKANEKVFLGIVSDSIARQIQNLTGVNVQGFKVAIEARQIEHILKDHGKKGLADQSMADHSNIAKMEYTLQNPDDITKSGKTQAYTHMVNGRNRTVDTVLYEKDIGAKSYYVVQAVPDTNAKTLYIVTAFIGKKGYKKEAPQLINAKSLDVTAKTGSADASAKIISQDSDSVKRKFSDRDNSYIDAVKRGDMEVARQIVDEAAEEAGYKKLFYHGTNNGEFTEFNTHGKPTWITENREYAELYSKDEDPKGYRGNEKVMSLYAKMENTLDVTSVYTPQFAFDDYKHYEPSSELKRLADFVGEDVSILAKIGKKNSATYVYEVINTKDFADLIKEKGYDSIKQIEYGNVAYGILDPAQLKSADVVTYTKKENTIFGKKKIIPVSERFDSEDNDIRYSDRDPDSLSNRYLLANALETTAQHEVEKAKLKQYKQKIELINSEEAKLRGLREEIKELSFAKGPKDTETLKRLQFEAKQTANRINTYDRQLLNLESTQALKNVLQREKQMAYKKAEQRGKEALAAYKERAANTQRELMNRYQESRKKGIESRNKTAMRHKIKDVVNDLNQYLLKGTKEKHVPIGLQRAVAEALNAVNMDTVGAEERIAKLKEELMKAKTPEAVQEISKRIERVGEMGGNMDKKLTALKNAYDEIVNSNDPLIANAHDEVISNKIQSVIESVGETPLRDMTLSQLEDVYDLYRMVLTTIQNTNKTFKMAKNLEVSVIANRVIEEMDKLGQKKDLQTKTGKTISTFDWNNQKPIYAFERIGSDSFTKVYNNVRAGEDTWAVDMEEAKAFKNEQFKKYKYDSWNFESRYGFTSTSGKDFELSLDQIMSLYAYSKRDQAADHLKYGGIVFDPNTEVVVITKHGIKVKHNLEDATSYNISEQTLVDIISKLTEDQRAFVDTMQDYLSTVMGEKGNEVSLALYDVKLFKEKNYFPLKSAPQYMAKAKEQAQGEVKIKNSGFSKETKAHAKNPIVLSSFMDVWTGHVNEMSMYHAFVLPMEDFYRVYNYTTPSTNENLPTEGVNPAIENAHGKAATQYIEQLLKDLNGGAISDPRENPGKALMTNFKKASVMASLSVVVQQPTAIVRAMALVDAKHFGVAPISRGVARTINAKRHKALWAEVKKYAPVAIIKEMGYFDTNMGRSAKDFLMAKEYTGIKEKSKALITDKGFRDEALSRLPALADEMTWVAIWEAVKRETLHKNPTLVPTSEEFLKLVGDRFTEVVTQTQVYDSVLSRSGNMRSKSAFMNMLTSFMGEPTTSLNMVQNAVLQWKKGNKKYASRIVGSVLGSVALNAALVSVIYAMRDDDEDETFAEKYLSRLTTELVDGINPLTYIPIVKDVWSIMQGFDIERADMSLITDLVDSLQKVTTVLSKDTSGMSPEELEVHQKSIFEAFMSIADSASSLAGIPFKNVRREVNGFINFFDTLGKDFTERDTTAGSLGDNILEDMQSSTPIWGWLPGESKTDKLYDAIIKGDTAYVDRLKGGYKNESSYNSAIRKALRENDSRINDAAQATIDGDFDKYTRILNEIVDEGHFSESNVKAAIKSEADSMKPDEEETESTDAEKETSAYTMDWLYMAIVDGDSTMAKTMKEDIINTAVANGTDREEAEKSFNSSFSTYLSKEYKKGNLSDSEALKMLMTYGGKDEEEAASKVQHWYFKKKHPKYDDLSESAVGKYYEYAEPTGISVDAYYSYYKDKSKATGTDANGDGRADNGTKKAEILAIINSLPLNAAQKDALYFAEGWKQSTLHEAPWR